MTATVTAEETERKKKLEQSKKEVVSQREILEDNVHDVEAKIGAVKSKIILLTGRAREGEATSAERQKKLSDASYKTQELAARRDRLYGDKSGCEESKIEATNLLKKRVITIRCADELQFANDRIETKRCFDRRLLAKPTALAR